MHKLNIEAVSNERYDSSGVEMTGQLRILVSVTEAETGFPVTGLTRDNFRVTEIIQDVIKNENLDFTLSVDERTWEPENKEPSGIYDVYITQKLISNDAWGRFKNNCIFAFGLEVKASGLGRGGASSGQGQTIVSVTSVSIRG